MSEKPILFSTPMAQAILAGKKTVTRRVVQWPVMSKSDGAKQRLFTTTDIDELNELLSEKRRHPLQRVAYEPSMKLWVRETFCNAAHDGHPTVYLYRADGEERPPGVRWTPSIHMPRAASRLLLPIASVRIERLQDITPADAIAEGIERHDDDGVTYYGPFDRGHCDPVIAFQWLWDSINGKRQGCSWSDNPWVWRIEFQKQEASCR